MGSGLGGQSTRQRSWVRRLLDLNLLLLGGVAVVVVVSNCHRSVPWCTQHSSLSLSLSPYLSASQATRVQWLGVTLVGVGVLRLLQLAVGLVFAAHVTVANGIRHRLCRRRRPTFEGVKKGHLKKPGATGTMPSAG